MRYFLLAGLATPLLALPVLAQTAPSQTVPSQTVPLHATPSQPMPNNPMPTASTAPDSRSVAAPVADGVAGANSFTESQARGRLEKGGFSDVSALSKDKDGIWRGRARKGSQEQAVGVDFKGNIVAN